MEEEIQPYIEDWIEAGAYPLELHEKAYKAGIQGWWNNFLDCSLVTGISYPKEFGGTPPEKFDAFYELIAIDEMARVGGGSVLGQNGINSMALPPILRYASDEIKEKVCRPVITGTCYSCSISDFCRRKEELLFGNL